MPYNKLEKKKSQVINCYKNKIKHPSRVRTLSIPGAKQELYQLHKKQPQIPSANKPVVTKISFFPLNTEIRQGCLSSSYYHEVREIKGIQFGKEREENYNNLQTTTKPV